MKSDTRRSNKLGSEEEQDEDTMDFSDEEANKLDSEEEQDEKT